MTKQRTKRPISPARLAAQEVTRRIQHERDEYFRFLAAIDEAQKFDDRFHVVWGIAEAAAKRRAFRRGKRK